MRVLVTGGAGFIGSHIVDMLVDRGHEVSILDNLSTGKRENINSRAVFYKGELSDKELVMGLMTQECPEVVIHQAAQASVPKSIDDPLHDAQVNIMGSINLLEACRVNGVRKVVYASTAAVYGHPVELPLEEGHSVELLAPYGITKYSVEQYLKIYMELYGLDYTVLRYANVYGPRQDAEGEGGVVAIFADKFKKGEAPEIHGDGKQTRDFVYVKDVAAANVAALDMAGGQVLNVSTNTATSIYDLFQVMKKLYRSDVEPRFGPERAGDIRHSYLDNSRAGILINWKPGYSLEEGLRETLHIE